MVKNAYEATLECLEMLHRTVCPECPNMPEKFKRKCCSTCTRTVGYKDVLKELSKKPWFETQQKKPSLA